MAQVELTKTHLGHFQENFKKTWKLTKTLTEINGTLIQVFLCMGMTFCPAPVKLLLKPLMSLKINIIMDQYFINLCGQFLDFS